jgi:hypothetical protein
MTLARVCKRLRHDVNTTCVVGRLSGCGIPPLRPATAQALGGSRHPRAPPPVGQQLPKVEHAAAVEQQLPDAAARGKHILGEEQALATKRFFLGLCRLGCA